MRHNVSVFILLFLRLSSGRAEDWPQFRGPDGQGHSSEHGLPLRWSETHNIVWKTPIPGLGWSSPVILDDRIWITTATDGGRSLRALSLHRESGKVLHDLEVFRQETPGRIHTKNSYASPTPILEGNRIFVHFGTLGTACLSNDGRILWKTQLEYQHGHGPGGSPVLFGDLLIVNCDGTDVQYVVALDKNSGTIRWKRDRTGRMAYSTPLVIRVAEAHQIVSIGGDRAVAYDPHRGREIWWIRYDGFSNVPRPVFGQGLVFICSGYDRPTFLYAVRPEGKGDVTESHVVWSRQRGVPNNPSPLLVEEELYLVGDGGIATCLNARTGATHWQERLGGNFSASPVFAEGHIYFLNEDGETTVVAAGNKFQKLAANALKGRTLASLAVSAQSIYLRSDRHLYRIAEHR